MNKMSFNSTSSHTSAFDRALSKPLIPPANTTAETDGEQKQSTASRSSRPITAAFSSKKLPALNRPKQQPTSNNPFEDSYRPPILAEEEEKQQQVSLLAGMEEGREMEAALLKERHTETLEITSQMRQIHEISQDLANIVNDQQSNFDVIEEDAQAVHDSTERGMGHLERAAQLVSTGSKYEAFWKVLAGVLAVGGLGIAIIILVHAFRS